MWRSAKSVRAPKYLFHRAAREPVPAEDRLRRHTRWTVSALLEYRNDRPAKALERRRQNPKPAFETGRAAQYRPSTAAKIIHRGKRDEERGRDNADRA